jgi:protein-S-isoprenylcysteine O-methyltransferase Ste14
MRSNFVIARKTLIVIAVWLAIGWVAGYLRPLDASFGTELPAWVQVPGMIALVVGAAGVLGCGVMLSTAGIGTLAGKERLLPVNFLATGPFRFVRNPMSLAGVILMVGIGLWHRSTLGLGLAAGLFVLFHAVVVYVEEPGLEKRFGDSYREYRRNVRRWLPRITPWQPASAEPIAAADGGRDSGSS